MPYYLEYLENGNKLLQKNKYQKAIIQYDKILEVRPYHPEALLNRGISFLKTGDNERACYDWNKIPDILNEKAQKYLSKYCN